MKPWAATCAVGSELGLLSAFHESWEPVNLAGKALGLTFYCCSDRPALQPSACVQSYRWTLSVFHSLTEGEDHIVLLAALEYLIMSSSVNACVHMSVSAHRFMKDDQMTR